MELRGHRRAKKPQSGFFSRHYFNGRVVSKSLIAQSASGFYETARRVSCMPPVRGARGSSKERILLEISIKAASRIASPAETGEERPALPLYKGRGGVL